MRGNYVAIVVGSLIAGLINILGKEELTKGSVIRLLSMLRCKIKYAQINIETRKKLANATRDSMLMLLDQHEGEQSKMEVSTFIETLSFSFEKEMVEFFGNEYMTTVGRFVAKQVEEGCDIEDSYKLADDLRDNVRKIIFDTFKG